MGAPEIDFTLLDNVADLELRGTLESLGRVMAERERENPRQEPEKQLSAKVIQLPLWPEARRGVPNDILRSALFAAIQGKGREYIKQSLIAAYDGVKIKYTGEQLDQSDMDVWEQILHLTRQHPLGTVCHFTAHSFLKLLGRSTGKKDYQWLNSVIVRLATCGVEIYRNRHIYGRGMIAKYDIDEVSRAYKVTIDPDMMAVYTAGWTAIDWEQRQQLRGKPLALWLHGYYASHAAPVPVKVDTLRQLCGSKAKALRSFRQQLGEALRELKVDGVKAIEDWNIDKLTDLVHVDRGMAISDSQKRHLTRPKRARKSKK
jgi:hypothetical protein